MYVTKAIPLLVISAIAFAHARADEIIYFLLGRQPGIATKDSVAIPLSKPEDIDHARDLIVRGPHPNGVPNQPMAIVSVSAGKDGVNRNYLNPRLPEWSWHVEKVLGFGDYFIEAIETTPTFLETHFDWSKQGTGTSDWAFDELTVVREFGPLPLYLSVIPEGQNLQFYWSTPSTNYVYTLEGKQSLASTNWLATPGAASPLKTNHCTLPLTNNPVPFYRVRAE